jgi:hypothetical protein
MPDKSWKAFERRLAALFGCKRRGPDFRGEDGGNDDLTHPHWSVEAKLLGAPTYSAMLAACKQAEANARGREPVAVVKRKSAQDKDALVVMRLETFRDWRLATKPLTAADVQRFASALESVDLDDDWI